MTNAGLIKLTRFYLRKHGLLDQIEIKIGRRKTEFGTCYWKGGKPTRIELSEVLLPRMPFADVKDTILHEIAHALDVKKRGYSNHDWRWKLIAQSIGARPVRYGNSSGYRRESARYQVECVNCGTVTRRLFKAGARSINANARRRCAACGPELGKLQIFDTEKSAYVL